MEKIEKAIHYSTLYGLYGELLSKSQQEIIDDYINYDLSISEISINRSISRSAVEDALKKGLNYLDHYENILKQAQRKSKIFEIVEKIKNKTISEEEIINELERLY